MSQKRKTASPSAETTISLETELRAALVEVNQVAAQAFGELGRAYLDHTSLAKKFDQATKHLAACEGAAQQADAAKERVYQHIVTMLGPAAGQWTLNLEEGTLVKTGDSNG